MILFERVRDARGVSAAAARYGAAVGVAGAIQEHAGGGAVCDVELLAGRGRAGGAAFLRDRGPVAVCGAQRSDRGGASARALQEDGRNAFAEFQVPQAVLALKQGFGRLIRTKTDRGVLALLDSRIQRMAYGKIFLESLPKYAMTAELADVARFLGRSKQI